MALGRRLRRRRRGSPRASWPRSARICPGGLSELGVMYGIGVATGDAFCGMLGSDRRREYAVLGDIVSLGARLAAAACEPGRVSVLCESSTADAGRLRWTFTTPVSLRLKG